MMLTHPKKLTLSFEQALKRLENVIACLEKSDCPLEEALALYQEGMTLLVYCRDKLDDAEKKVTMFSKETGKFERIGDGDQA